GGGGGAGGGGFAGPRKGTAPPRPPPPLTAGDCHAMLGQWREAAELFAAELTPEATNPQLWARFTELALVSGGSAGYRSACEKMLKQFGGTKAFDTAESTAWACGIGPDALADMTQAVGLACLAVKTGPRYWNNRPTLGATFHRSEKREEAGPDLPAVITMNGKGGTWADHLFLAMAQHKLGKIDEALKSLAAARSSLTATPPGSGATSWSVNCSA